MTADFEPYPDAVGPAIMAWYALHDALEGDPAMTLAWAAKTIAGRLEAFGPGVVNPLTLGQASVAIDDARMFLGFIAEIFNGNELPSGDEPQMAFKAVLKRPRGRPAENQINSPPPGWWGHVKDLWEVEALIAAGDQQKVAVGKVAKRLGLGDAVVAGWLRERRKGMERSKHRVARQVEKLIAAGKMQEDAVQEVAADRQFNNVLVADWHREGLKLLTP